MKDRLQALLAEETRLENLLADNAAWKELRILETLEQSSAAATARRAELQAALASNKVYGAWSKLHEATRLLRDLPEPQDEQTLQTAPLPDDLTRIRGIDRDIAAGLARLEMTRFADIARLSAADVRRIRQTLGLGRRLSREQWIEQAAILAAGNDTAFSRARASTPPQPVPDLRGQPASATIIALPPAAAPAPTSPMPKSDPVAAASAAVAAILETTATRSVSARKRPAATTPTPTPTPKAADPRRAPIPAAPTPSVPMNATLATSVDRILSRSSGSSQRRSLLAAIEAAENAAARRNTPAPRPAAKPMPRDTIDIAGSQVTRSPADAATAFGRSPQRQSEPPTVDDPPSVPGVRPASTHKAPAARALTPPAPDNGAGDRTPAPSLDTTHIVPIGEPSDDIDAKDRVKGAATRQDWSDEAAVQIVPRATAQTSSRAGPGPGSSASPPATLQSRTSDTARRPATRDRDDDADGKGRLSPHVGLFEEASVEIVHRGGSTGDAATAKPVPQSVPQSVSQSVSQSAAKPAPRNSPIANPGFGGFGRFFRGRSGNQD